MTAVEGTEAGIDSADDARLMRELRVHADVILAGAAWLMLPRMIDAPAAREAFCRQILQATGLHASVETMEVNLAKGIEITGRSLMLRETVGGKPVVEIPFIRARLGLREVLRGEVSVHSLLLDGMQIVWGPAAAGGERAGQGRVGAEQFGK